MRVSSGRSSRGYLLRLLLFRSLLTFGLLFLSFLAFSLLFLLLLLGKATFALLLLLLLPPCLLSSTFSGKLGLALLTSLTFAFLPLPAFSPGLLLTLTLLTFTFGLAFPLFSKTLATLLLLACLAFLARLLPRCVLSSDERGQITRKARDLGCIPKAINIRVSSTAVDRV